MQIRTATPDDAEIISSLNDEVQRIHAEALPGLFKPPSPNVFSAEQIVALVQSPDQHFLIAEEDGQAVGYLYAETLRRPENELRYAMDMLYIHHISIRPEYRSKGFGTELMDAAAEMAREQGISLMALDVWAFNTNARAAFEHYGFEEYNIRMWKRLE